MLPVVMLLTVTACQKETPQTTPTVAIAADASFSASGEASLTVTLSAATSKAVLVQLAASSEAQSGYTAVRAADLTFDSSVSIPAGSKSASIKVSTDVSKLDESYQAVIVISAADGATLDNTASTVYIGLPVNVAKQVSGADAWKITGDFDAIALTKTSDSPETWSVENAEFGGAFQFGATKGNAIYALGASAAVTLGQEFTLVMDGAALSLEEGAYNVTIYPAQLKAVITEGVAAPKAFELDWKVEYLGLQWVEGYYNYGQLDVFEVSGTTPGKYYIPYFSSLDNDDMESYGESLKKDAVAFIAEMQENIDGTIELYLDSGYTVEDFLADQCYSEANDGPYVINYGQPAGEYEFLVLSMDADGKLDLGYKYITVSKDTEPESQYDWGITPQFRSDWTAEFDGWDEDYEGYAWMHGTAPGAKYVYLDVWTDEEIEEYLKGDVGNMIGNIISSLPAQFEMYREWGYTDEEIIYGLGMAEVDADGKFTDASPNTYGIPEGDVYILGFDENLNYVAGYPYGKVHMTFPVPEEPEDEPLELSLQNEWSVALNGEPYEDGGYYYQDVVVTAPGIQYFWMEEDTDDDLAYYYEGSVENLIKGYTAQMQEYLAQGYSMNQLCFAQEEAADAYFMIYNYDVDTNVYLMEFDENGKGTGRYGVTSVVIPSSASPAALSAAPKALRIKVVGSNGKTKPGKTVRRHRNAKLGRIAAGTKAGAKTAAPQKAQKALKLK